MRTLSRLSQLRAIATTVPLREVAGLYARRVSTQVVVCTAEALRARGASLIHQAALSASKPHTPHMPPAPSTSVDVSLSASTPQPMDPTPDPTTPDAGGIGRSAEPEGDTVTRPATKPEEPTTSLVTPQHKAGVPREFESTPVPAPQPTTTDDGGPVPIATSVSVPAATLSTEGRNETASIDPTTAAPTPPGPIISTAGGLEVSEPVLSPSTSPQGVSAEPTMSLTTPLHKAGEPRELEPVPAQAPLPTTTDDGGSDPTATPVSAPMAPLPAGGRNEKTSTEPVTAAPTPPGPTISIAGGLGISEPVPSPSTSPQGLPAEPATSVAIPLHKDGEPCEYESTPVPTPLPYTTDDGGPDPTATPVSAPTASLPAGGRNEKTSTEPATAAPTPPGPTISIAGGLGISEPLPSPSTSPQRLPAEPATSAAIPLHKDGEPREYESTPVPTPLPYTTDDGGPDPTATPVSAPAASLPAVGPNEFTLHVPATAAPTPPGPTTSIAGGLEVSEPGLRLPLNRPLEAPVDPASAVDVTSSPAAKRTETDQTAPVTAVPTPPGPTISIAGSLELPEPEPRPSFRPQGAPVEPTRETGNPSLPIGGRNVFILIDPAAAVPMPPGPSKSTAGGLEISETGLRPHESPTDPIATHGGEITPNEAALSVPDSAVMHLPGPITTSAGRWQEPESVPGTPLTQRGPSLTSKPESPAIEHPPTFIPFGVGLEGIQNLGDSCYMNAALQCLCKGMPLPECNKLPEHSADCVLCTLRELKRSGSVLAAKKIWEWMKPRCGPGQSEAEHALSELLEAIVEAGAPPVDFVSTVTQIRTCQVCEDIHTVRYRTPILRLEPDQKTASALDETTTSPTDFTCPSCKSCSAEIVTSVDEPARSLFLGFKEGHFGDTKPDEVTLPESFIDASSRLYTLTGMIQHVRFNEVSGHYVSYTTNGRGGWLKQDDSAEGIYTSKVTQVKPCVALYLRREQLPSSTQDPRRILAPSNRKPSFFYGVAEGRSPGVYTTWEETKREVHKYRGAVHQRFVLRESAQRFVERYNPPSGDTKVAPPPGSKWYAVVRGRKSGLYDCWREASSMVNEFTRSRYKAFNSRLEASLYWWDHMAGGPQQDSPRMCLFFASHRNLNTGRTGAAACLLDTQLHKLTASWGATLDTADLGLASYYAALKGIQKMSQQDRNATWSCRGNMNTWSATTRTGLAGAVPDTWSFLNTPNVANNCAQFKAEEVSSRDYCSLMDVLRRTSELEGELGLRLTKKPRSPDSDSQGESASVKKPKAEADHPPPAIADPDRSPTPSASPRSKKQWSPGSDSQDEPVSVKKPKTSAPEVAREDSVTSEGPPLVDNQRNPTVTTEIENVAPTASPVETAVTTNVGQSKPEPKETDIPPPNASQELEDATASATPVTRPTDLPTEGSPLPSASLRTIVATIDPPEKGEHDASEDTVNTLKEEVYDAPGDQTDTLTGEVRDASEEPADILTVVEHDAAGELADTLAEEVRDTAEQPADILTEIEQDASGELADALDNEVCDTSEEPVDILTKEERDLSSPSSQLQAYDKETHTPPVARTLDLDSHNSSTEDPTPKTRRARSSPPRTGTSSSDVSTNDTEDTRPTCDHAPPLQKGPRVKCDFCHRLLQRKWFRSRCTKCQITTCRRCWTAGVETASRALDHPDSTPRHRRTRSCPSSNEKTKKKISPYSSADSEKTNLSPGKRLKDDC